MQQAGAVVIGVSKDSLSSHEKFALKETLNFSLIADPEGDLITLYGAWKPKTMFGKTALGIERCTFLIGADGRLKRIWRNVKVDGHDHEVLAAVRTTRP